MPDDGGATVLAAGRELGRLGLPIRGRHNLVNALAAVAVGIELGVPFGQTAGALGGFGGVGRRYEERGEHSGVLVVDDYGHHPTEIAATLQVTRSTGRPVAVLFQPHRYSRTQRFHREFADALAMADKVALLPIYPASESPIAGVDSGLIAEAMQAKGLSDVTVLENAEAVPRWLDSMVQRGDLLLTTGAGDIGRMVDGICAHLDRRDA